MTKEEHLETRLDAGSRTVHYYLQLGRWLGFVDEDDVALTDLGQTYVSSFDEREQIYTDALYATPLVQALVDVEGWADETEQTASHRVDPSASPGRIESRRGGERNEYGRKQPDGRRRGGGSRPRRACAWARART